MRLLHLSDIHFKAPGCSNPRMDRDAGERLLMVNTVKQFCEESGRSIDAILITGDIAFKADIEEFDVAREWLLDTAKEFGAKPNSIFVVPGNHDIDRTIAKQRAVNGVRETILKHNGEQRLNEFLGCLRDPESADLLMRPLKEYNAFAAHFGCNIWVDGEPFWTHELELGENYRLRLNGLTTVFFSGETDKERSLYLGGVQSNLMTQAGVVDLVMCHHPPSWLEDGDTVEDQLHNRAAIRLFGHKHRQRQRGDQQGVTFSAGAMNPDRHEQGWEPGFNILDIEVLNPLQKPLLSIDAHVFRHQDIPEKFVPKEDVNGENKFSYQIAISLAPRIVETADIEESGNEMAPVTLGASTGEATMEKSNLPDQRSLSIRFWNLQSHQRRDIVNQLELVPEEELSLPQVERYRRAFIKARENNKMSDLVKLIEEKEAE